MRKGENRTGGKQSSQKKNMVDLNEVTCSY